MRIRLADDQVLPDPVPFTAEIAGRDAGRNPRAAQQQRQPRGEMLAVAGPLPEQELPDRRGGIGEGVAETGHEEAHDPFRAFVIGPRAAGDLPREDPHVLVPLGESEILRSRAALDSGSPGEVRREADPVSERRVSGTREGEVPLPVGEDGGERALDQRRVPVGEEGGVVRRLEGDVRRGIRDGRISHEVEESGPLDREGSRATAAPDPVLIPGIHRAPKVEVRREEPGTQFREFHPGHHPRVRFYAGHLAEGDRLGETDDAPGASEPLEDLAELETRNDREQDRRGEKPADPGGKEHPRRRPRRDGVPSRRTPRLFRLLVVKGPHRAGGGDEKEEREEGEGQRVGSGGGGEKLEEGDGAQLPSVPASLREEELHRLHPEHEQRKGGEEVAASEQEVGRGRGEEERDDRRSEPGEGGARRVRPVHRHAGGPGKGGEQEGPSRRVGEEGEEGEGERPVGAQGPPEELPCRETAGHDGVAAAAWARVEPRLRQGLEGLRPPIRIVRFGAKPVSDPEPERDGPPLEIEHGAARFRKPGFEGLGRSALCHAKVDPRRGFPFPLLDHPASCPRRRLPVDVPHGVRGEVLPHSPREGADPPGQERASRRRRDREIFAPRLGRGRPGIHDDARGNGKRDRFLEQGEREPRRERGVDRIELSPVRRSERDNAGDGRPGGDVREADRRGIFSGPKDRDE